MEIGEKKHAQSPDKKNKDNPVTKTYEELKATHRRVRDQQPQTLGLRIHRSLSWLDRAEQAVDDPDIRFICLWIAFNAAYVEGRTQNKLVGQSERGTFGHFFAKIHRLDADGTLYKAFWHHFSGPVRLLMQNPFVFGPFWAHNNGLPGYVDWQDRLARAQKRFHRAFKKADTVEILKLVFDRLYILRNQMIHGGTTWCGSVNREQMKDGTAILAFLIPRFIEIMMANPDEDWGHSFYPVVEPGI